MALSIDELYRYEYQGRMLASGVRHRRLGELRDWLWELERTLRELYNEVQGLGSLVALHNPARGNEVEEIAIHVIEPFIRVIGRIRSAIAGDVLDGVASDNMYIAEYFALYGDKIYDIANNELKVVCRSCSRRAPSVCCWAGATGIKYETPALVINDITAIYHRIIEMYTNILTELGGTNVLSPKSRYTSDASPEAVETLATWDKATRIFYELDIYASGDADALTGFAFDNVVELRVGSAARHLTKINVESGYVDYYDDDRPVVEALEDLFKQIGGWLERYEGDHAVYWFPPKYHRDAAYIMALATSMDYRVNEAIFFMTPNLFSLTFDYERYKSGDMVYYREVFLNVSTPEDIRQLERNRFIEKYLKPESYSGFIGVVAKNALKYALEYDPEAYNTIGKELERLTYVADEVYFEMKRRGLIDAAISQGLYDYEILNMLSRYMPDHYAKLLRSVIHVAAILHWYFLKAVREFYIER